LLSADGHRIVFSTDAALTTDDTHEGSDVYVADVPAGTARLVSKGVDGLPADGRSEPVGMSADGSLVLVRSFAHDLIRSGVKTVPQLYLADLRSGSISLVSKSPANSPAAAIGRPSDAWLARDGSAVVFDAAFGQACGSYGVYLYRPSRGTTRLVSRDSHGAATCRPPPTECPTSGVPFDAPVVSDQATVIAYHSWLTGKRTPCASDGVIVHTGPTHRRVTVLDQTRAMPGPAEDTSAVQWLTPDGRYIVVGYGAPHRVDVQTGRVKQLRNDCNYTFPVALTPDGRYAFWACQAFDGEYGDDPSLQRTDLATGHDLSVDTYLEDHPYHVTNLVGFTDDGRTVAFIDKHGRLVIRGPLPAR
jgi:hypothetical protein